MGTKAASKGKSKAPNRKPWMKIKNPQPKRHPVCLRGEGMHRMIPHGSTRAFYSLYSVLYHPTHAVARY